MTRVGIYVYTNEPQAWFARCLDCKAESDLVKRQATAVRWAKAHRCKETSK